MALTKEKARKILHDGMVRGRKLSGKQRKLMGAISKGLSNRPKYRS